jgi:hypothetical protein
LETKFRVPIIDDAVDRALAQGMAEGLAQGVTQGMAEGVTQGMAQALLLVLDARFTVPAARRTEVSECTDAAALQEWTRRAVSAKTLDEVFSD